MEGENKLRSYIICYHLFENTVVISVVRTGSGLFFANGTSRFIYGRLTGSLEGQEGFTVLYVSAVPLEGIHG